MFGPLLFLCLSVCREMNAVGARIPDDHSEFDSDNGDSREWDGDDDNDLVHDDVKWFVMTQKPAHAA